MFACNAIHTPFPRNCTFKILTVQKTFAIQQLGWSSISCFTCNNLLEIWYSPPSVLLMYEHLGLKRTQWSSKKHISPIWEWDRTIVYTVSWDCFVPYKVLCLNYCRWITLSTYKSSEYICTHFSLQINNLCGSYYWTSPKLFAQFKINFGTKLPLLTVVQYEAIKTAEGTTTKNHVLRQTWSGGFIN